jgi:hypothetical protein
MVKTALLVNLNDVGPEGLRRRHPGKQQHRTPYNNAPYYVNATQDQDLCQAQMDRRQQAPGAPGNGQAAPIGERWLRTCKNPILIVLSREQHCRKRRLAENFLPLGSPSSLWTPGQLGVGSGHLPK